MPRYTVRIGKDAEADLAIIRDYLSEVRDAAFASRFISRLIAHCETFRTIPHRGTRRDSIRAGLRTVSWKGSVTIAFYVSDDKRLVTIVAALYRGRDVTKILKTRSGD